MTTDPPRRVAVVGAGMVGLATAWFLQERGLAVTVLERDHVAAGASWGNAGWLTPSEATPLPSPAVLRYGVRAMASPTSPVYVPLRADAALLRFLASFARHCTATRWTSAMRSLVALNAGSLDAYDELVEGGVASTTRSPVAHLACFPTQGARAEAVAELEHIRSFGQPLRWDLLDGDEARALTPLVTRGTTAAIALREQRYLDPGDFVGALARAVVARGGVLREGTAVGGVVDTGTGVDLLTQTAEQPGRDRFDAVVVATGTWLPALTRSFGVRLPVQAGRGYSFSVPTAVEATVPLHFPAPRLACTPWQGRLRIAGMMEFRPAEAPLDQRRLAAIVAAARPLLAGVDLDDRQDEWVGSRPVAADGLPLIGPTRSPRVWVAGGHGMWGVTHGPVTGRLVAEGLASGRVPDALRPFSPTR
jgi:D-amino-acid dehydrogenase